MKVLLFDLECSPKLGYFWGIWKQNIPTDRIIQDTYLLCWSAKWLDDEHIYSDSLHYHSLYKQNPESDKKIVESLWKMLDEADTVIGHNGDAFDIRLANEAFIRHGMKPPSGFKSMDTLKMAKSAFRFTSNRLDALGQVLKVGKKIDTGGFSLWKDIVKDQNIEQFDKMVEYCEQDVFLLEKVYKKLRPWDKRHINLMVNDLESKKCNVCGSEHITKNGTYTTNTFTYQRYLCSDCGHTMRSRYAKKLSKDQKKNILRSC